MTHSDLIKKTATPALFAKYASRGRYKIARHIEVFDKAICDAITGRGPNRLIITIPPRHGKSAFFSQYLPAWFLGTEPDKRVLLASYGATYAETWGEKARNLLAEHGSKVFSVSVSDDSAAKNRWNINGRTGGMDTTGVSGALTGKGADLLVIDDPIKDFEQALSQTYREKTWDWWESTAFTRLEPGGIVVVVQTRWHEDDMAGRLEARYPGEWHRINMPALAEKGDILGRKTGEALFPERYTRDALLRIKAGMREFWWAALYQQRPAPEEGGLFKREHFIVLPHGPRGFFNVTRYWDKAGTHGDGDYSAGVLMAEMGGVYWILDVCRGQWSAREREQVIKARAVADKLAFGGRCETWIEQEPGSGGKESAENTIRNLAGVSVRAERVTGDKVVRADPFAAQVEGLNVQLVEAPWNEQFLQEAAMFPNGAHDDQIDAAAGAFNKLAAKRLNISGEVPTAQRIAREVDAKRHGVLVSRVSPADAVRFGGAARRIGGR